MSTRMYDVVAFQMPANQALPDDLKLWELNGTGSAVTGIMKLAQLVLLELLTVKGSRPFDQSSGTSLLSSIRQGIVQNELDARTYFQYAVTQLQRTLQMRQLPTDPPDEIFASLTVNSLTFTPLQISYNLTLLSQAGVSRTLILPVSSWP